MAIGSVLIPVYYILDVVLGTVLYRDASLVRVVVLRAIALAAALFALWVARDVRRFSERAAQLAHTGAFLTVAVAISAMAPELGGPASPYLHGLTVMVMVRAATVPAPARDSLFHGLLIAFTYPVVLTIIYLTDPTRYAAWTTRSELSLFAAHWLIVFASVFCGSLGSRAMWISQRQLFEARKLGRYRLQVPIGKGGQGEVWLARDNANRRNVALKVVSARDVAPHHVQLFEREAAIASQLASPHSLRIFDFGASDDGVYYLAMEHLDGADLGALVKSHGAMPAGRVIHFGIHACRSLEEAHAKGLVHRDVKPSNLFAAHVGDVYDHLKLLDFGIARSLSEDERLTRTGVMRGTPAYMAPELFRGEDATASSDMYGLGATLYHLLAGSPPFSGQDAALIAKHLDTPPEPLRARIHGPIDADLEAVILRCLAKTPAERFPDAAALRRALEACAAAGTWTGTDAARFWGEERKGAVERWEAETLP